MKTLFWTRHWLLGLALCESCVTAPSVVPVPVSSQGPISEPLAVVAGTNPLVPDPAVPKGDAVTNEKAGDRTGDGIDDENWLPRKDTPAYSSFMDAVALVRGNPRGAMEGFLKAAAGSPGFYAAWFNAGVAAEAAGELQDAEKHYYQALKVRPDYGLALTNLAALLSATGRDDEARRLVDEALTQHADKAGPHVAAGLQALRVGDLVKAEREAREAVRQDERNVPAMLVMAQVFRLQGRLETARFAVDNALALEPGNPLLHVERGRVLQAQGERKDALVAFERGARLQPTLCDALEPYGRLLLETGLSSDALQVFLALARLRPQSGAAQVLLANALRATKDYLGAEAAYKKALVLEPNLHEVHFNLGVLYIDNVVGDRDELVRLQRGVAALRSFEERALPDAVTKARLVDYLDSTDKRISREAKRRERDQKRKADDAKESVESQPGPASEVVPKAPASAAEVVNGED